MRTVLCYSSSVVQLRDPDEKCFIDVNSRLHALSSLLTKEDWGTQSHVHQQPCCLLAVQIFLGQSLEGHQIRWRRRRRRRQRPLIFKKNATTG